MFCKTLIAPAVLIIGSLISPSSNADERLLQRAERAFDQAIEIAATQSRLTWLVRAKRRLEDGRKICARIKDSRCFAEYHFANGQVLKAAGSFADARRAFEESRDIWAGLGFQRREAGVAFEQANAVLLEGNTADACSLYQDAIDLFGQGEEAAADGDEAPPVLNPGFQSFPDLVVAYQVEYCQA